jgi:hypothetical protein
MSADTAGALVNRLFDAMPSHQIITFNGSFDFLALYNVLDPTSPEAMRAKLLPLATRDIFCCFACAHGHFVSLNALATASGVGEKLLNGMEMPAMWAKGSREEQNSVLAHCENDVRMTHALYCKACRTGELR